MVILFSVFLYGFIQIISAEILRQDVASLDVLNNLQYIPLADLIRSKRQFNNPPASLGKNANLPTGNGMPIGNIPGKGLPKNIMYKNGLFNNYAMNGKSLPYNLPFTNVNSNPQYRLLPNINGINNNAFTVNNLPIANNVIENLSNLPNPANVLPNNNQIPNILPNNNNVLDILPAIENNACNVVTPPINNILPQNNNVLPLNNLPNINLLPLNNLPNSNVMPINNLPNSNLLPPNNLPINNLSPLNNLPTNNLLPINNLLYSNLLPSNSLPNNNILPLDNLPNGNVLPPNNLPNSNFLPQNMPFNNLLPSNVLPSGNVQPINNLPNGNVLPTSDMPNNNGLPLNNLPINTLLPNIKNFRITGFQFADGVTNFNGIPQNNLPRGNLNNNNNNPLPAPILPDIAQRVSEEISNINSQQINNVITGRTANPLPINPPFNNEFSSIHLPIGNAPPTIANEQQNINFVNVHGMPDTRNVLGNQMPVMNQQFNVLPIDSAFQVAKHLPVTTANLVNSLPPNILNNVILVDPLEAFLQNVINSGILNNNCQLPVNNIQYEYINSNMPVNQNFLANDCQADFVTNNLDLAQEIVKNLRIEGLPNLPFLNGLPVAGITETVTVLNSPCK